MNILYILFITEKRTIGKTLKLETTKLNRNSFFMLPFTN